MLSGQLSEYQKSSCPFCAANVPHERHVTRLEMTQLDLVIGEMCPVAPLTGDNAPVVSRQSRRAA